MTARARLRVLPLWVAMLLAAAVTLFPVYWMLATAVRPRSELYARGLHLWPSAFEWWHFAEVWNEFPLGTWVLNSAVLAVVGGLLSAFLDLTAGYAFAKFRFPGRDTLFLVMLSTMMVPSQVLLVPQFLIVAGLGGMDTGWGVLLPRLAEAFGVFLVRQFMAQIPDELLEAARMDGASEARIFFRIVLPLSKPLVAVLVLFSTVYRWNEFAWPMVILKDRMSMTMPAALGLIQGERSTDWTAIMVVTLLSALPPLLLFAALQRYFVRGISRAGLK